MLFICVYILYFPTLFRYNISDPLHFRLINISFGLALIISTQVMQCAEKVAKMSADNKKTEDATLPMNLDAIQA